jgi:organic radical activating enzyme
MSVKNFYNKGYVYNERAPYFINQEQLTNEQRKLLTESKTFCMMPWVHMHAFPDGRTYPCCLADYWHPVGDLRKNTMHEVWNQAPYKTMRQNMIKDKPCKECTKCYEQEENGFFSMRYDANRNYGHHIAEIDQTQPDGTHPEFKIRYWDVRFSNLCNFSCRSCGPIFSSNWYNDHVKLYDRKPDVLGREMLRVEYTAGDEDAMLEQMLPHIPHLEQVYFAGGEPLIMKEHYFLLEKLIEHGKTDIRIQYNTNFSELRYKDKHVFDYWRHFKNVSVGASLDASGERAELMRKGTDWKQTVKNRQRMMEEVPHVDFYISATVSAMNVLHVLDFHREWTELGLIEAKDFNINLCQSPEWYRANIFPQLFKDQVIVPRYQQHLEWLRPIDSLKRATNGFESLLKFILTNNFDRKIEIQEFEYKTFKGASWPNWKDFQQGKKSKNPLINKEIEDFVNSIKQTNEFNEFKKQIEKLDNIRNENFWKVFPELNELA